MQRPKQLYRPPNKFVYSTHRGFCYNEELSIRTDIRKKTPEKSKYLLNLNNEGNVINFKTRIYIILLSTS